MPISDLSGLQSAIYARLSTDDTLMNTWQVPIIDAPPNLQSMPDSYIRIGEETAIAMHGAEFTGHKTQLEIAVFTKVDGFANIKALGDHIIALLRRNPPTLTNGSVVGMWFYRAQSQRLQNGNLRVLRLQFRAIIDARLVSADITI